AGGRRAPQTTLSRVPLLHSYEPRDFGLALRLHAEDTGLGSTPPPSSAAPTRSSDCTDTATPACCFLPGQATREGGVGRGGALPGPVSSGELFRSDPP